MSKGRPRHLLHGHANGRSGVPSPMKREAWRTSSSYASKALNCRRFRRCITFNTTLTKCLSTKHSCKRARKYIELELQGFKQSSLREPHYRFIPGNLTSLLALVTRDRQLSNGSATSYVAPPIHTPSRPEPFHESTVGQGTFRSRRSQITSKCLSGKPNASNDSFSKSAYGVTHQSLTSYVKSQTQRPHRACKRSLHDLRPRGSR